MTALKMREGGRCSEVSAVRRQFIHWACARTHKSPPLPLSTPSAPVISDLLSLLSMLLWKSHFKVVKPNCVRIPLALVYTPTFIV